MSQAARPEPSFPVTVFGVGRSFGDELWPNQRVSQRSASALSTGDYELRLQRVLDANPIDIGYFYSSAQKQ